MAAARAHAAADHAPCVSGGCGPVRRAPVAAGPQPGNLAVQALHRSGAIRARLTVGDVDDPAEHAAEAAAESVMRGEAAPPCPGCAAAMVRREATSSHEGAPREGVGALAQDAFAGGGAPLPAESRGLFEGRLGADLGGVRVHTGAAAAQAARAIGARAFTLGADVAFAEGEYAPESSGGRRLLAHELAHVVQAGAGQVVRRQPAPGGEDRIARLRSLLGNDSERAAIDLMALLTPTEVDAVLVDASLRALAVDSFDDDEMGRAVLAMRGNAVPSLAWLFAEGCEWEQIGAFLRSAPRGLEAVLPDDSMRHGFVEAVDDAEMAAALLLLPGPVARKMEWLRSEGATFDEAMQVLRPAPAEERAALYARDDLRDWFVEICDDREIMHLVLLLGGTLRQKLGWMQAEGSSMLLLGIVLEKAPQPERATLLTDASMRRFFQDTLDDDEMQRILDLIGGPLSQRMEWLQAEGAEGAPAHAELPPALESVDVQLMDQLEGRSQLLKLLKEYESARSNYIAYNVVPATAGPIVGGMAAMGDMALGAAGLPNPRRAAAARLRAAEAALNAELTAQGFTGLEGFLDEIRRFEALFLGFGLQTAFAMLADNHRIATAEKGRYTGSEAEALTGVLYQGLFGDTRGGQTIGGANRNDVFTQVGIRTSWGGIVPGTLKGQVGTYPILAHPRFYNGDLIDMVAARDAAGVGAWARSVAESVLENIEEARSGLREDTGRLWQLEGVIDQAKSLLGIMEGSVFDELIKRKVKDVEDEETFKTIVIAALAIGLGLLSGGTGAIAVLAGGASLGLSAFQAVQSWNRYAFTSAAHGSALDPARALTQVDPSALWLAVDVLGVFLDLHGFAAAINRLREPAKAAITATRGAEQTSKLADLRHQAGEVAGGLRAGQDIVSADAFVDGVMRSAERQAARRAVLEGNPELTAFVRQGLGQLGEDEATVAGLVSLGRETAESAMRAFSGEPQILARLAGLAESEPAMAAAIGKMRGAMGEQAFANVMRDALLRRETSRAGALASAVASGRVTPEQLERIAAAGRQADPAARARAISEELDRTLREATGMPAHGSAQQAQALESTRNLTDPSTVPNPEQLLADEIAYVENARALPVSDPEYVAEVVLPNGHRWRQTPMGRWCRFSAKFCMIDSKRARMMGRVTRAERAVASAAPLDWPIYRIDPRAPPDIVPPGVVLEFPTGERVWRSAGAEGGIVIESRLGSATSRQNFEAAYFSRSEMELPDYVRSDLERAHSQGQGTGFESPYAIPYAPREVNQVLQNTGIEMFLREMEKARPDGVTYHLVTSTSVHPGSRRLKGITYRIDISHAGQRRPGFTIGIEVSDDIRTPRVRIDPEATSITPGAEEFLPINDLPVSIRDRLIRMFGGRWRGRR
jgi:hypothetical protein